MLSKLRRFLACTISLLAAASAFGQTFDGAAVQAVLGNPYILATGDFDQDGHPDVVYQDPFSPAQNLYTGGALHVMLNNGNGTFHEVQQLAIPLNVGGHITVADVNGDGFPDLIVGYVGFDSNFVGAEFATFLNNGDGTFGAAIFSPFPIVEGPTEANSHLAVADFDGDGHIDFIFDSAGCGVCLMRGDGAGHFSPQVLFNDQGGDAVTGDFNEDGKPDFAIRSEFAVQVGLNQGNGAFAISTITPFIYFDSYLYLADINNDGHLDILYSSDDDFFVAAGHGDGTFSPVYVGSLTAPILGITDVNDDGLLDVVSSNLIGPMTMFQNASGKFSYTEQIGSAVGDLGMQSAVYADFDGDGIKDVVSVATGALVLSRGRKDGTFVGATSYPSSDDSVVDLQVADFNGDGNLDLELTESNFVYTALGDGAGNFSLAGYGGSEGTSYTGRSSIGDFNGDGHPDIFNAGYALYGDGTGQISSVQLIAPITTSGRPSGYTAVADFNEDGRPDAITGAIPSSFPNTSTLDLALSSGAGAFTTSQITVPDIPGPLVTADFNHDGHTDLAVASTDQVFIFSGDGKGNLTLSQTLNVGYSETTNNVYIVGLTDLEAADIDGDGNVDLLVPVAGADLIQIFYGRSDGTFDPPVTLHTDQETYFVTVADMDLDGKPDLVLGGNALVRILHGLGGRTFGPAYSFAGNPYPQKIRVADVNHDGLPDMLVPNGGASPVLQPGQSYTVLLNKSLISGPPPLTGTLTASPEPSNLGQAFTLTATLAAPAGTTLSGDINFSVDGTSLGSSALTNNAATIAGPTTLAVGTHPLTATWGGNSTYPPLTLTGSHVVANPSTITGTLHATPEPSIYGGSFAVIASLFVSGVPPTGTISFSIDGQTFTSATAVAVTSVNYTAILAPGSHQLSATYSGDANYPSITFTGTHVIEGGALSMTLYATPEPSSVGAPFTITATLAPPAGTTLSGNITFSVDGTTLGSSSLTNNAASVAGPMTLTAGTHQLSATWPGDASYAPVAVSTTHVVAPPPLATVVAHLTASPQQAFSGATVVLIATVTPEFATNSPEPTGTVTFTFGGSTLGTVTLSSAGVSVLATTTFPVGIDDVTCTYSGDANYAAAPCNIVQIIIANNPPPPADFTLTGPTAITFRTESTGSAPLLLTSINGFSGPITLTCNPPLPVNYLCTLAPTTPSLAANSTASSIITLRPNLTSSVTPHTSRIVLATLFPLALLVFARRRRSRFTPLLTLALLAVLTTALTACGPDVYYAATPPGTYPITVTATGTSQGGSAPTTHTLPLNIVITP
jgi:hypothetical protein